MKENVKTLSRSGTRDGYCWTEGRRYLFLKNCTLIIKYGLAGLFPVSPLSGLLGPSYPSYPRINSPEPRVLGPIWPSLTFDNHE